jgi:chloramphenicol 3-O-phosphotransferase
MESQPKPQLVVLHGLPAVGKYTIGKVILQQLLSRNDNWKFFHNHLVVDTVLALFPFGSPNFCKHREIIWKSLMADAIAEKSNILFTFSPDTTVTEDFPEKLKSIIENQGGQMIGIKITCENGTELTDRMKERQNFSKLNDVKLFEELSANGAFDFPHFPVDFKIDSSQYTVQECSSKIVDFILSLEK